MKRTIGILSFLIATTLSAQQRITVAADGTGDFRLIQEAINSLSDTAASPRTIFIKKGVYKEKLLLKKHQVQLEGEGPSATIITYSIARDEWRCDHPDDWGVATLNVQANDISLKNLAVINSFGFDFKGDYTVNCPNDSSGKKTISIRSHQMALRTMNCTRLRALNCHFKAFGGDTVSPWETNNGMWYFKDCVMEGGVDFYCPRGWAWAENCHFITHTGTAAIWHDGSANADAKTVLLNCRFSGFDGFSLGRYHRDAQFYLLNCLFDANMKDAPIYLVPTGNTIQWGERIYYNNCRRAGGKDFAWYRDNLPAGLRAEAISTAWVFGQRWQPAF